MHGNVLLFQAAIMAMKNLNTLAFDLNVKCKVVGMMVK